MQRRVVVTGISVVASGVEPGLLNSLFHVNPGGTQHILFTAPAFLAGSALTFQSVIFNTASLIGISNAVEVAF